VHQRKYVPLVTVLLRVACLPVGMLPAAYLFNAVWALGAYVKWPWNDASYASEYSAPYSSVYSIAVFLSASAPIILVFCYANKIAIWLFKLSPGDWQEYGGATGGHSSAKCDCQSTESSALLGSKSNIDISNDA
jgi:hypothetical protein